jgi:hypothetical protein
MRSSKSAIAACPRLLSMQRSLSRALYRVLLMVCACSLSRLPPVPHVVHVLLLSMCFCMCLRLTHGGPVRMACPSSPCCLSRVPPGLRPHGVSTCVYTRVRGCGCGAGGRSSSRASHPHSVIHTASRAHEIMRSRSFALSGRSFSVPHLREHESI